MDSMNSMDIMEIFTSDTISVPDKYTNYQIKHNTKQIILLNDDFDYFIDII
jgi:hypothetical protein